MRTNGKSLTPVALLDVILSDQLVMSSSRTYDAFQTLIPIVMPQLKDNKNLIHISVCPIEKLDLTWMGTGIWIVKGRKACKNRFYLNICVYIMIKFNFNPCEFPLDRKICHIRCLNVSRKGFHGFIQLSPRSCA